MIVKVLSGNSRERLTDQKEAAVRESLDKMRNVAVRIAHTRETVRNKKSTEKKQVYEGLLCPVDPVPVKQESNGQEAMGYRIIEVPVMYQYAEALHQIISIPTELLDIPGRFSDTRQNIQIKRYVILRFEQILGRNKLGSDSISLCWKERNGCEHGMLIDLGYSKESQGSDSWRKRTKPMILTITQRVLDHLVEQGIIHGYTRYRQDGTGNRASPVTGFKLTK